MLLPVTTVSVRMGVVLVNQSILHSIQNRNEFLFFFVLFVLSTETKEVAVGLQVRESTAN